ncbi:MAG: putative manganese-dependent inorganic diphosphatase [Actinomycetota bacterium]|jgi:manganese-dependent inorganic pyrophosphatase|nr:putative manganese-dependent inorganic diphosphatase [Actinomycetota bacterium]
MGPVLVFGHRNPDNDSICSAVAYAHLKNLTDAENVYVPARLGPVPPETAWVLGRFGVQTPERVEHVHARVRDVMTENVVSISAQETMLEAGRLMREHGVRALPVVDGSVVRGLINVRILAERYLDETQIRGFSGVPSTVGRLVSVLEGSLVAGDENATLGGDVLIGAMEPTTMLGYIKPGDTLVVGDRVRTQPMALDAGVACLIVTGGATPGDDVMELATRRGAAVISTFHDTYATARLINLSVAVADVMDTLVLAVGPDTLLSEASEDMLSSTNREAVVVSDTGALEGILTRTNVARGARRRVILVDHNETAQSAVGIESADVVEIVDHHRVGDVQTVGPILFLNLPMGSTATIVALRYEELGVDIPIAIAGVLLSAVLSDTVLLKSPTTTDGDRAVASRLAASLDVDPVEFGMDMFRMRTAGEEFSAKRAVEADLKEYRVGDISAAIGQIETVDLTHVMDHVDDIRTMMESLRVAKGYDLVVLMITDVVREGSEILAVGKTRLVERGLDVKLQDGSVWMDGVLSRKKQIAPHLVRAAGA